MSLIFNKKVNVVLVLLILVNIVGLFVVKDAWASEIETGWQAQISKVLYGLIILLMIPSALRFNHLTKLMSLLGLYSLLIIGWKIIFGEQFDIGFNLKILLVFLSFPFFVNNAISENIDKRILLLYVLTEILFIFRNIFSANVLAASMISGEFRTGQGISVVLTLLLPLVCIVWKPRYISYYYIIAFLGIFISLRRTAMLAHLLCLPFIFTYIKNTISKKMLFFIVGITIAVGVYIMINFGDILEARFMDIFEEDKNGNYGSGRSEWYSELYSYYINQSSIINYIFGFGIGAVADIMTKHDHLFTNAHNDYLELLLTYGIFGIVCFYLSLTKMAKHIINNNKQYKKFGVMSYIVILLVGGISGMITSPTSICVSIFFGLAINNYSRDGNDNYCNV